MSDANDSQTPVRIRRVPKFSVFLVGGAVVGEIVTLIATSMFPVDPTVGFGPLLGYFSVYGLTGGLLLGAIVALILDRILSRRAKTLTATVARLEPEPDEPQADELQAAEPEPEPEKPRAGGYQAGEPAEADVPDAAAPHVAAPGDEPA